MNMTFLELPIDLVIWLPIIVILFLVTPIIICTDLYSKNKELKKELKEVKNERDELAKQIFS